MEGVYSIKVLLDAFQYSFNKPFPLKNITKSTSLIWCYYSKTTFKKELRGCNQRYFLFLIMEELLNS